MVYCNFDTRTKGVRSIPKERLVFLRELEAQVKRERETRRIAKLAGLAATKKGGG